MRGFVKGFGMICQSRPRQKRPFQSKGSGEVHALRMSSIASCPISRCDPGSLPRGSLPALPSPKPKPAM